MYAHSFLSITFIGAGSPQKSVGLSEEVNSKKQAEDNISMASSLHSSPPASPQGSPRKGRSGHILVCIINQSIAFRGHCYYSSVNSIRMHLGARKI